MKIRAFSNAVLMAMMLLGLSMTASGKEPPVAKLVQIEGTVEYSRNGTDWRPVTRTKYLFAGYQIKTGSDGGGKLINQENGMSQDLGPNSEIVVQDSIVALVNGSLSEPKQESATIFEGLSTKFATAQRYTTVRRSVTKHDESACDNKVRTISNVTLSPSHPDLVWRNACPEYSYKLIIDGKSVDISAESTSEMIRYAVTDLEPGEYAYRVEVLDNDGTVYIPRSDSSFTLVDAKAEKAVMKDLEAAGDDVFVKSGILEQKSMYVAAMDGYREYFRENPDDNDMRPLLIQSYQDLKLSNLRESEARLYNAALEEGL
ncbi:MAG: hypothetical protein ACI82A_002596 [Candidatus Azotimanducaceae bacterium]|jgi:hypothetical protein